MDEQSYAFANVREVQSERLRTLEALLDAGTIQHLERRGVRRGWRCLEVGAGGGSITSGRVTATEVDEVIALSGDPRFRVQSPITMAAWGRRPAATSPGS